MEIMDDNSYEKTALVPLKIPIRKPTQETGRPSDLTMYLKMLELKEILQRYLVLANGTCTSKSR